MQQPQNPEPSLDRRAFIKQGLMQLASLVTDPFQTQLDQALDTLQKRHYFRPPGAQLETLFLSLCTRCDACTAACPHETIAVHYGSGPPNDGTPYLPDLQKNPCLLCTDTPCISACPTEALVPVSAIQEIRIGTAIIDMAVCSAYRGSGCKTCYNVCPLPDTAIQIVEGLPQVLETGCTGCGICQHHCPDNQPEEDPAIQVVHSSSVS